MVDLVVPLEQRAMLRKVVSFILFHLPELIEPA